MEKKNSKKSDVVKRSLIKTRRLILKQQSLCDFAGFFAMSKDPVVMRYIGDGSIYHWTREVALKKFKAQLAAGAKEDSLDMLAVYRQADGLYLGWSAISHSKFLNGVALEYRFCRDAWGRGFATEAACAILEKTYATTASNRILACVHPDNAASICVLAKLGFEYAYAKHSKPIERDIPVYKIDRNRFLADRAELYPI